MTDALAERIAEALRAVPSYIHRLHPELADGEARIAADVAREWMEGKAVVDGKVWRLDGEYWQRYQSYVYRLIPIEQEDA